MITGKALRLSIDVGAATPTVILEGDPTPHPFVVTPGLFHLGNVTWNGERIGAIDFGNNWTAEGANVTVTLNPDESGVSQETDFAS